MPVGPVFARVGICALVGAVVGFVVVVVVATGFVVVVTGGFVVVVVGGFVVVVTTGFVVVVVTGALVVVVTGGFVVVVVAGAGACTADRASDSEGGGDVSTGSHAAPTITSANAQITTPAPPRITAAPFRPPGG